VALFELLVVDEVVRELIHQRAPASALRDCARRSGMRSLRAAGAALVASGRTTPDEVLRVTHADDGGSEERADAGLRL
jgi:general secretion pathway protein E